MKYRKKPVIVEANQFTKRGCCPLGVQTLEDGTHYVVTIHGDRITVVKGDWIIQEPDGIHYYPCKPGIFADTYEPA
jgi:hypothetical protein